MPLAAKGSLGYARVAGCTLYVSSRRPPVDSDWAEYVQWFQKSTPPASNVISLVYERSTGPNAAQRKQISDMTAKCKVTTAVIAASSLARGLVTAVSWFKEGFKAFNPNEVDEAIAFIGLKGMPAAEVRHALRKMLDDLDAISGDAK